MKKILIIVGLLIIVSFLPLFNSNPVYTGACTDSDCSNGPFVTKVSFWEHVLVR
jgi:hypothetical protein